MAESWTPPDPLPATDKKGGAWTPPDPIGGGRAGDALGALGTIARLPADISRGIVEPLIIDPARNLAADAYGLTVGGLPTDAASREKFNAAREKSLKGTELPGGGVARDVVKSIVGLPGEILGTAIPAASEMALGHERTAALAPYATMIGDVLPLAGGLTGALRGRGAPAEAVAAAKAENRGRSQLSERFQTGLYEGGPSALDLVREMQKARDAGQPYTLLDANNKEMQGAIGTAYRQGGPAQGRIGDFLENRKKEQLPRTERIISEAMGDPSIFTDTAENYRKQRSANARPLWAEAEKGPGLAALQQEFTQAWQQAGAAEFAAAKAVADAENRMTQARGRQDTAGNVYSSSGSNAAVREAQQALNDARRQHTDAVNQKAAMRDLMDKARLDGTLRPDAVWSPYLDILRRDNPHVSRGIARGWDIERNKAHGSGEAANPRDYAIVGFEENGDPIVGAVPNMKLWMVAKEGLDAEIADNERANNGHVDKMGHSLIQLRDGLINELDRLNPRYAPARQVWQGDSASMMALEKGRNLLDSGRNAWFKSDQEAKQYIDGLSPTDRELTKLSVAHDLLDRARSAPDAADKSKRVVNTDIARTRLQMLLGDEAGPFLEAVEREAEMERNRGYYKGGSPTAERRGVDTRNERRADSGWRFLSNLASSFIHPTRIPETLRSGARFTRAMANKPDLAANEAISRLATDPNLQLSTQPGGPILPRVDVPRRYLWSPTEWSPLVAEPAGASLERPADNALARVLRYR